MDETNPDNGADLALWQQLVVRAARRGVPLEDARDLAQQAFLRALEAHDPARGAFAALCGTTHANLLRNWWRDRKPTEPWDEELHDRPVEHDPHARIEDEEDIAMHRQLADRILAVLEPEEVALFLELGRLCREAERAAVSAAAARLGLEPAKGWDIFRRIQRKARPLAGQFRVETSRIVPLSDSLFLREDSIVRGAVSAPEVDLPSSCAWSGWGPPRTPLLLAAAGADAGFGEFLAGLAPDLRARLRDCFA